MYGYLSVKLINKFSGNLELGYQELWVIEMIEYNTVVWCYGKMLVNVAVYVIHG